MERKTRYTREEKRRMNSHKLKKGLVLLGFEAESFSDTFKKTEMLSQDVKANVTMRTDLRRPSLSASFYYNYKGDWLYITEQDVASLYGYSGRTRAEEIIQDLMDLPSQLAKIWERKGEHKESAIVRHDKANAVNQFKEELGVDPESRYGSAENFAFNLPEEIKDNPEMYIALLENEEFKKAVHQVNTVVKSFIAVKRL